MTEKEIKHIYDEIEQLYKEIDTLNHKLALHISHKTPCNSEQERFNS